MNEQHADLGADARGPNRATEEEEDSNSAKAFHPGLVPVSSVELHDTFPIVRFQGPP